MSIKRRPLLSAPLAAFALLPDAFAQPAWPARPIRLIIPYSAGGGTDILARALAEALRPHLPHPIVVENRAGGNGVIGTEATIRAEPDGHTLCAVVSTHVLNRHTMAALPYDPVRDVSSIALLTRNTMMLAASHTLPFNDMAGLRAFAAANPRALSTGSTEALSQFLGQEMARRIGADITDVQYRAGSGLMTDIVAGHLPLGWTSSASVMPHLPTGRVKVIACSTATRTPFFPQVATMQEQGFAGFDLAGWVALLGPAGMAPALIARIGETFGSAFRDEAFLARLTALGIEPDVRDGAGLLAAMRREDTLWADATRAGHITRQ